MPPQAMPPLPEHPPGATAPAAGIYELLNVVGRPVGIRVFAAQGEALPPAALGQTWRLAQPGGYTMRARRICRWA